MDDHDSKPQNGDKPFDRFKALAGKLVRVPKKEVDRKEAAYQRKRARKRRTG